MMSPKARLSIACFFAGLSAVIVAGFIAVILLLTLSQRRVYADAVNQKIDLAQQKANLTVLEPLIVRERMIDVLTLKMVASPIPYVVRQGTEPHMIVSFFNDIQPMLQDPLIGAMFQLVELNSTNPAGTNKDVAIATMYRSTPQSHR